MELETLFNNNVKGHNCFLVCAVGSNFKIRIIPKVNSELKVLDVIRHHGRTIQQILL
jgi:hypothetical protein